MSFFLSLLRHRLVTCQISHQEKKQSTAKVEPLWKECFEHDEEGLLNHEPVKDDDDDAVVRDDSGRIKFFISTKSSAAENDQAGLLITDGEMRVEATHSLTGRPFFSLRAAQGVVGSIGHIHIQANWGHKKSELFTPDPQ